MVTIAYDLSFEKKVRKIKDQVLKERQFEREQRQIRPQATIRSR